MNATEIKLTRKKVDEYRTEYHFGGTKHLGPVVISKHHGYDINKADKGWSLLGKYEYLGTLKAVKAWIAGYDERYIADKISEAIEEDTQRTERNAENAAAQVAQDQFLEPIAAAPAIALGDTLSVYEGRMSKPNSVAEVINEVNPAKPAVVKHIINVTNEEFDAISEDLYSMKSELLSTEGGWDSDDDRLTNKTYDEVFTNPELTAIFHETAYMLANVVIAPNRNPLIINTEGYAYPRYIAFIA